MNKKGLPVFVYLIIFLLTQILIFFVVLPVAQKNSGVKNRALEKKPPILEITFGGKSKISSNGSVLLNLRWHHLSRSRESMNYLELMLL